MAFTERTVFVACSRQTRKHGYGADCACCGKNLFPEKGKPQTTTQFNKRITQ
jgi:methionyl-tRNA synthetase